MREKLIEILEREDITDDFYNRGEIADRLLDNGVTVQKWIPVTERLPEVGRHVLAWSTVGDVYETAFWNGAGWYVTWDHDVFVGVTHWIPLPEPPEEE